MELDPVLLSRLQFAFVIAFHILLPAFTVGLASYIVVLEGMYFWKGDTTYLRLSLFWTKMFAVSFGMGVVSGIVMPFQFGTNWSGLSDIAGNVLAPLLTYEGLIAFFLEAGFLGILLFGRKLVPPWVHLFAAVMVGSGTLFSSFWILSANSWMHTPAGYEIIDGRFFAKDWVQVIFNPSFPYRIAHTVTGFFVTTAFVVIAVSAWHLRQRQHVPESQRAMSMGLGLLILLVPLQIVLGDAHGLNTLEYQPAKVAAMEGLWTTQGRAPAVLFAIPDSRSESNQYEIAIPGLASVYLTHDVDGVVKGLKDFSPARPTARTDCVLGIPGHGGHGHVDACCCRVGCMVAFSRTPVRVAVVSLCLQFHGTCGIHCRDRRLDSDRGRSPAVGRVWLAAHARTPFRLPSPAWT